MLEILMIYTALTLILVPIFRVQGAVHGYSEVKECLFIVLSAAAFIGMLFTGIPILSTSLDWIFAAFILFVSLSVYWSDSPTQAVREVPRYWGFFLLYLASRHVPHETLMMAIFLPAVPITIYGIIQEKWAIDPIDKYVDKQLKKQRKKLRFYSFLGNANYSGAYLVGTVFAGAWCVQNISYYFALPLALVLAGVYYTKCRAAWLAIGVGILGVIPEGWPYMVPFFVVMGLISTRRKETFQLRVHFLNVGWMMFKERFLTGWGPSGFRRQLFKTQAFMNQTDPELLGTLEKPGRHDSPLGKRMHNDHAEMLVEFGLIGGILWAGILGLAIYQGFTSGSPFVTGAIIAISVNCLFFYPVRSVGIGIGLWAFLGASGGPGAHEAQFLALPLYLSMPLSAIVALIAWQFAIKRFQAIKLFFNYHLAMRAKKFENAQKYLTKAIELDPYNGNLLSEAAMFYSPGAPPMALSSAFKALDYYDGEKIEWSLWLQLGKVAECNGAAQLAQVAFKMAIYLNPSRPGPHECLAKLHALLDKLKAQGAPDLPGEGKLTLPPEKRIIEVVR